MTVRSLAGHRGFSPIELISARPVMATRWHPGDQVASAKKKRKKSLHLDNEVTGEDGQQQFCSSSPLFARASERRDFATSARATAIPIIQPLSASVSFLFIYSFFLSTTVRRVVIPATRWNDVFVQRINRGTAQLSEIDYILKFFFRPTGRSNGSCKH